MVRGYLRHETLYREMRLQPRAEVPRAPGSTQRTYAWSGTDTVDAIRADATPRDIRIAATIEETVTNEIIHEGPPLLENGDRFQDVETGKLYYIVHQPEDPGLLGHFTVYLTEERDT
jgi:hypothetical protein